MTKDDDLAGYATLRERHLQELLDASAIIREYARTVVFEAQRHCTLPLYIRRPIEQLRSALIAFDNVNGRLAAGSGHEIEG